MEGSLITPVIVTGGTFGGNATLAVEGSVPNSGDLTVDGGAVRPGGDALFGTITVGNNLVLNGAAALLDTEVDSVANTDFIDVTGTATISGGTLAVEAAVGNFLEGEVITILNAAGGITGTFSVENLPLQPNGGPLFRV